MSLIDNINNVRQIGRDGDDDDINDNMKASVDKSTGLSDNQISYDARVHQMTDDRVAQVADDQRRRGVVARARITTPVDETPHHEHRGETIALSDLDPFRRA